jgi:hypothetical protein
VAGVQCKGGQEMQATSRCQGPMTGALCSQYSERSPEVTHASQSFQEVSLGATEGTKRGQV